MTGWLGISPEHDADPPMPILQGDKRGIIQARLGDEAYASPVAVALGDVLCCGTMIVMSMSLMLSCLN